MAQTRRLPLRGGNVLEDFCEALIIESNRSGQSVNEVIIRAAGERLAQRGLQFTGVFEPGDLDQLGIAR
ncbi:hypothetical protein [Devosia naphthalenivorans]|uniref:hypothetical protein n=1 Tax=Devosia naphthalenivorans TaxID=2082392 RepID=UPI000D3861C3|nr:hypothetical protein [Devosia naphthalenivorans]